MKRLRLAILILGIWLPWASAQTSPMVATVDAVKWFKRYEPAMCQIRVIDLASNEKASIGSGFLFDANGRLATNFHVIAEAVHDPDRYRVEAVYQDGGKSELTIRHFDIVMDVAIVKDKTARETFIPLGASELSRGARLFSLGNPYDLGPVIVEGTYNGLIEKTLYRKILFSGSLNPGMSGGPTIDAKGRVIGINVSTAGNEISLLVPVERLQRLVEELDQTAHVSLPQWKQRIADQLTANQQYFFDRLFTTPWEKTTIGEATVPAALIDTVKCWGDSDEETFYRWAESYCSTDDGIFVSSEFRTGWIAFEYQWLEATQLNTFQFYTLMEESAGSSYFPYAEKDDVTRFQTESSFVRMTERDWKIVFSARRYKQYPQLFDVAVELVSVNDTHKGLHILLEMSGVEKDNAMKLVRRFLEEVEWPH